MIEGNIQRDRLRLAPAETSPMTFYMSNSMNDLKPGDHIEIQIRRRKESPYSKRICSILHHFLFIITLYLEFDID